MYFCAGLASFEKILHGKSTVAVLVLLLAISLAPWFVVWYQPPGHSVKTPSLPAIPTAFTGRSEQIQRLIHYVVTEHISIVAVTGGPGYGKSSVAIVSSHELVKLGIPVYYVSLSEVNSIEAFVMTFMQAVGRKIKNEQTPGKGEFLSWTSSLDFNTVVVLDNADLLTLTRIDLRDDFLQLLKDATARSSNIHFVVATRYRFQYTNDFAAIHLSTLDSADAIALLRRVVLPSRQTSDNIDGSLKEEHLKGIANRTGGIPLALKVVGELVKSGIVSTAEVLDELAANPVDALSRESFPPDEQLKRCFSLSYKYLSQSKRNCLIYASRFPGTFDRRARDAVITNMTGDSRCLDQLVDRSLVEYSSVDERYTMHALLRTFAATSVEERPPKSKYFSLFCSHYISLLSASICEARAGGDINHLYTTITADYHNFLHVLQMYTDESTRDTPPMSHKDMLLFANHAFDVMKSTFPWKPLVDWWTVVLNNICRRVNASDFNLLAPQFIQLSTKFGNLLWHHKQFKLANHILQFADKCIDNDTALAASFATCQHPQADSYTGMLQALMKVYEEDGLVHRALEVRERLHLCVGSAPDKEPEDLIPNDFCTVGITYLREKHSQSRDFDSAKHLFDANFRCFGISDEEAPKWIKMLEDAYEIQSHIDLGQALGIAKRCNIVRQYRKEADWLTKVLKVLKFIQVENWEFFLFTISFRLARLHWSIFNDADKAVEHGKVAYSQAVRFWYSHRHIILKASLRLADILYQVEGNQQEAGFYFEEALKLSPFVSGDEETIYMFQSFAELHLIYIHYHSGERLQCIQHYGQWANLEAKLATRSIVGTLFGMGVGDPDTHSLAERDYSLHWILDDINTARKFLNAIAQKVQNSMKYFASVFVIILIIGSVFGILIRLAYNSTEDARTFSPTLYINQIASFIVVPYFCFHYFLYHAITKRQVRVPRQLPQFHPPIGLIYAVFFLLYIEIALTVCLVSYSGLPLVVNRASSVYSPFSNMSMKLEDKHFYKIVV